MQFINRLVCFFIGHERYIDHDEVAIIPEGCDKDENYIPNVAVVEIQGCNRCEKLLSTSTVRILTPEDMGIVRN